VSTPGDTENTAARKPTSGGQALWWWFWDTVRTWGPALLGVLLFRSCLIEPFRIPSGSMVPTLAIGDHIAVTKFSYGLRLPLTRIPLTSLSLPDRGDVVVFVFPESDAGRMSYWLDLPLPEISLPSMGVNIPGVATLDYVKRVVGLPGETIEVKDNVIFINGEQQTQTYQEPYTFVDGIDQGCRNNPTRKHMEHLDGKDHEMLTSALYASRLADWGPRKVPEGHVFVMGDNRDHSSDSRDWGFVPLRNIKGKAQVVWLSYDQCEQGVPLLGDVRGPRVGLSIQ
jgi:signal peptidase I